MRLIWEAKENQGSVNWNITGLNASRFGLFRTCFCATSYLKKNKRISF